MGGSRDPPRTASRSAPAAMPVRFKHRARQMDVGRRAPNCGKRVRLEVVVSAARHWRAVEIA